METNVAALVTRARTRTPDAEALVAPGVVRGTLSWAELDERVDAVAAGLAATGLVAGQRVALLGRNSVELVVAYLAALRAGLVAVPLNPALTAAEVDDLLRDSGARLLLAGPGTPNPGSVPTLPLTPDGLDALAASGTASVDSPPDPETLAVLLYTAGTSGPPRAVMLTHRALLAHLQHVHALGVVGERDTVLGVLPLFHVFGLNAVLGGWLVAGARFVVVDASDQPGASVLDVLAVEPVQHLPLSPAFLRAILADPRSRQSPPALGGVVVVSGAAPLSTELAEEFTARTGATLGHGYGLTEAAPGVSLTIEPGARSPAIGHVGRPLPGVEVRIADGADPGEPGEIEVRGANLFSGYWPDGTGGPGAAGWFGTGDVGYLDDAGELFLLDRARELVGVAGFAVYPVEVEQVIAELPGVDAVAVVGQPGSADAHLVAFVVGEVDAGQVLDHCRARLARFKQPGRVEVVDDLPRGATGKVRKGVLRESLLA